ncbi:unnamed protein product [Calypogeia fissa]
MEALQSRRLLIQSSYGSDKSFSNLNSPNNPAAGYGSGSCATTNYQAGRVSLSSSTPSDNSCYSLVSTVTHGNYAMSGTRGRTLGTASAAAGGNWLCPNGAPSTPREVKFRTGYSGNWSSFRSSRSSSTQDFNDLLLVASHPPTDSGKAYSVIISTTPFDLWQRRTQAPESPLYKTLKISASSIFYWLKRNRKELLEIKSHKVVSNGYHRRTPLLHRFFRYNSPSSATSRPEWLEQNLSRRHGVGSFRSTSEYYNGYSSVSSQAEGNTLFENAILVEQQQQQRLYPNGDTKEFLATGFGWRVRDAALGDLEELIKVADIQTGAFHEKSAVFDDLFYKIFRAEIVSSLQYKSRHSDPDKYSCLLAEGDPSQHNSPKEPTIVGAVDITAFADKSIVCHLPGAEEYLYVSGMAVDSSYRRQGVATVLLDACLARAVQWGFEYLVLHAHEDDLRARNLYSKAGYNTVSADPAWMTTFFGRRRRVVMARRTQDMLDST